MQEIQSIAVEVLTSVALGVISLLGAYAVAFIRKAAAKIKVQTDQIADDKARKQLQDAMADAEHLATLAVSALEQTTAKALREAVKDGKVDRKELTDLRWQAYTQVRQMLSQEAKKTLAKNMESLEDYVLSIIEAKVLELKSQPGPALQ